MQHKEYALIANSPMDPYFAHVIDFTLPRINGGHVCDLGAHALGHYWATGYIERVDSYSCYDLSQEALDIFKQTIKDIKPGYLKENQGDLLQYLYDKNIIQSPASEIEKQLVEKLAHIKQFDFLKDIPDRKYDVVFAMESLAVVDTYEEMVTAMKTAKKFLKDKGTLLAVFGHYKKVTNSIQAMQKTKISGSLNPDMNMFKKALVEAGFKNIEDKTVPIDYPDYLYCGMCVAKV